MADDPNIPNMPGKSPAEPSFTTPSAPDAQLKTLHEDEQETQSVIKGSFSETAQKITKINQSITEGDKTLAERFTEGYQNTVENLKKQSNVLTNTQGALKNDFDKLGMAFAPLTSIPGLETAMVLIKGLLAKVLLFMISAEKRKMLGDKMKGMKDRLKSFGKGEKGKPKVGKIETPKKGFSKLFFGGMLVAIKVFLKGFLGGFQQGLARVLKFFGFKKWAKALNLKGIKTLQSMGGLITSFGNRVRKFFTPVGKLTKSAASILKTVAKPVTGILKGIGMFGKMLGKLFWPIQVIIAAVKGIIGFLDGFKRYQGEGFVTQLLGGLVQGIMDIVAFIIGWPMDLLKKIVTGIGNLFGFDMSMLEDFSFQDMFSNIGGMIGDYISDFIAGIKTSITDIGIGGFLKNLTLDLISIFKKIYLFPVAVAAGAVKGLAAAWPGGDSPGEAFMQGFNKVFNAGDTKIQSLKSQADGMDEGGNEIEERTSRVQDAKDEGRDLSNYNDVKQVTTVVNNNNGKKVMATKQNRPTDDFGHRLAYS